jgi:hypothetical protein
VVVDVETTPARTHDEVKATKTMKSTEDRQRGNLIERSEGGGAMTARLRDSGFQGRAEALDDACLRAWGHPNDRAIRQELLSALEREDSVRPVHTGLMLLRDVYKRVWSHC